jgi:SAM-dependent methyltransferase
MIRPGFSIFIISAAAISYEILLIRLLSIIQWHHFVSMIISLALLGYGASGTFVALFQKWLIPRFAKFFISNAILFGLTMVGSFVVAQHIAFNPLEILWENKQFLRLLGVYLTLFVPFFCASNCICIIFARFKEQIHRIYRFDLLGAGTGALFMVFMLCLFPPNRCLIILGTLGPLAAGLLALSLPKSWSRKATLCLILIGCAVPFAWPQKWVFPQISEYKGLSLALRAPNTKILSEHFSPLGWLAVVQSPTIPFRYAPGMSLNCSLEPPQQLGIFIDGDNLSPITRYAGKQQNIAYLDFLSSALPYHLLEKPEVLILGAGGGMDVLTALYHKAKNIDAVEVNPQVIDLLRRVYADFAGHIYEKENVRVHRAEGRGFVSGQAKTYDLIQVSLLDSFSASISGAGALTTSYLYTMEALQEYFQRLKPGGLLAITRWLKVPPRDALKLFGTAITACRKLGTDDPGQQLVMIRSWKTTTLLYKKGVFTNGELSVIKFFCHERSFDIVYYPGIRKAEVNRYNLLEEPYFYQGAMGLLGQEPDEFIDRYKFHISPATDDRPYFFRFFKWRTLREILGLKKQGGLPLLEWGYPILVATLFQAVIMSFVLVLLPLMIADRNKIMGRGQMGRLLFYFSSLGLAFLFIEMAFIQKFILFLHHPVYAVSAVLCAFLVFAGLGSGYSQRCSKHFKRLCPKAKGMPIATVVAGIGLFSLLYVIFLPHTFHHLISLPNSWKIPITIFLIAPLAFFMGMPFPLGLSRVAQARAEFIPWAWAVNGCASVLSAILATLLSVHFGFNVVIGMALMLYFFSAVVLWRPLDNKKW